MQRFWDKVDKSGDCWLWLSNIGPHGYGTFWLNGKPERAHRVAWVLENGEIPNGLCVLHACDTTSCVRPDHLWLGSHQDNMADMVDKGRSNPLKGECCGGAKLTSANVIEIRASQKRQKDLAEQFNVDPSTISDIMRRKSWQHLDEARN